MTEATGVTPETEWRSRLAALLDRLTADGTLTDPTWRAVLSDVPRHLFVPRFHQLPDPPGTPQTVDRAAGTRWWDAVYADQPLVTRYLTEPAAGTPVATSAVSQPSVVVDMLQRLDLHDGQRVLEIGTGAGYNAALLCRRLGAANVSSVDIDADLVATAGDRLAALGYRPRLAVGDGAAGLPAAAPFHRIIATCAITAVPPGWIGQLTPDGRIVAPVDLLNALAVLDRTGPDTVTGRLADSQIMFMPLRERPDHPYRDGTPTGPPPPPAGAPYTSVTQVNPQDLAAGSDFRLWLHLHLRRARYTREFDDGGTPTGLTVWVGAERATVDLRGAPDDTRRRVVQYGPRRPWDTVEAAWWSWRRAGRPGRTRLGLTAGTDPDRQYLWLDRPDGKYSWPLPL